MRIKLNKFNFTAEECSKVIGFTAHILRVLFIFLDLKAEDMKLNPYIKSMQKGEHRLKKIEINTTNGVVTGYLKGKTLIIKPSKNTDETKPTKGGPTKIDKKSMQFLLMNFHAIEELKNLLSKVDKIKIS